MLNHLIIFILSHFPFHNVKCDRIPEKTRLLAYIIPGNISTYIYDNEEDYYNGYKTSLFALSCKKGGWDCLRHYEILANGCIPYFPDIKDCPVNTMTHFPKQLIVQSNLIYERNKDKSLQDISHEDLRRCHLILKELLEHTRRYLTTEKMAQYVLDASGYPNASKILFLSGETSPDYLRCLTLHGFKSLFGTDCHDSPMIKHIYKEDNNNYKNLYGKGITYTNLLPP